MFLTAGTTDVTNNKWSAKSSPVLLWHSTTQTQQAALLQLSLKTAVFDMLAVRPLWFFSLSICAVEQQACWVSTSVQEPWSCSQVPGCLTASLQIREHWFMVLSLVLGSIPAAHGSKQVHPWMRRPFWAFTTLLRGTLAVLWRSPVPSPTTQPPTDFGIIDSRII